MIFNNKIKALLQLFGENITSYAKYTDRTQNNVSNKLARGSWTAKDLLQLAEMTGTRLVYMDDSGKVLMELNINDLETE